MSSTNGRFIQGRFGLPLLWVVGAAFPLALGWAARPDWISRAQDAYRAQDTYYVVAHLDYVLSIAAWFVIFAAVYLGLSLFLPRFRRTFGLIHLGLMVAGAALIFSPQFFLALTVWPRRYDDPRGAFTLWNTVSTIGYTLMLAGLVLLAAAVISGIPRTRSAEP
jgi:cytochrome c oxidase subunit 1